MDKVYFEAAIAAAELEKTLMFLAKNRNYIGKIDYDESEQVRKIRDIIKELEDAVSGMIGLQTIE